MERAGVNSPALLYICILPGLLEEILQVPLLLLEGAPALIRTPLSFLDLVTAQGPRGLLQATLCLVHRAFGLILTGCLLTRRLASSAHKLLLKTICYLRSYPRRSWTNIPITE